MSKKLKKSEINNNVYSLISEFKPVPAFLLVAMIVICTSVGIIMGHSKLALIQVLSGIIGLIFVVVIGIVLLAYVFPRLNRSKNHLTRNSQYSKPIREIVRIYERDHSNQSDS